MRIASFNVENLFDRAKALELEPKAAAPILNAYAELNTLLDEPEYTAKVRKAIQQGLDDLTLTRSDESEFVILRQNHGRLLKRPRTGPPEIVANGRADWIGWVELKTRTVNATALSNTAKVILDVDPDILGVVEVDNRVAMKRFADAGLVRNRRPHYPHVMVVDGNDDRGIDVGILLRDTFTLGSIHSHVDDLEDKRPLFSRDCPEYEVFTPAGERIVVLVNHLKSKRNTPPKGTGRAETSDTRRRKQAARVAEIYARLQKEGVANVVVLGDLNDTPESKPLAPLLRETDLTDVIAHPEFDDGGRPGTWGNCTASGKFDYILLSPAMFERCTGGGVFRKGMFGGTTGTLWEHYPTVTRPVEAASDHAAVYADFDID
jgi:endonuclease/exonuclease/phosphatase family metal-dependent hydrolase